jgi:hypothetical protein
MGFSVSRGVSGRACCQICNKPIAKGEMKVDFWGYKVSQQAHLKCITELKIKIIEKEIEELKQNV